MTHGGYIIAVVIGFLTLTSQWKAFAGNFIILYVFFFIISSLVGLGISLVGRTMWWGYLSDGVLRVKLGAKSEKKTIMFQLHEKTIKHVKDNHWKASFFRVARYRMYLTIGVTFTLWMFLNSLSYFLVETNISLSIFQIFGLIWIIFLLVFVIVLSPPIRRRINVTSIFGKRWKKKIANYYEDYLYILVIIRHILLFFAPLAFFSIVDFSIVLEHSLSLILMGLSVIIFVSIQLPQLMKAHILVTFTIDKKPYDSPIVFESGKEILVEGNIYNLGFSTYKNFVIIFYFGEDFERAIVPCNNAKYQDLSFKKKFGIQKRHGGVFFSPKDNFLTIPPQEVFVFPMYIKVPKKEIDREMHIEFYSESSWGKVVIKRRLIVQK